MKSDIVRPDHIILNMVVGYYIMKIHQCYKCIEPKQIFDFFNLFCYTKQSNFSKIKYSILPLLALNSNIVRANRNKKILDNMGF